MKQQVFVSHGGDAYNSYEEFIAVLRNKQIDFENRNKKDWKSYLSDFLGEEYDVILIQMPNKQNAKYSEWKIWFEKYIPFLNDGVILVGHSLGGIFLAKYLSEEDFPVEIRATFLVAAPFNTSTDHPLADFVLEDDFAKFKNQAGAIYLYQSKDDTIVPFSNFESYHRVLPGAQVRIFDDRKHFNQDNFPEIVEDIKGLE